MTHWWAPFALLATIVTMWLTTSVATALEMDRGWSWWKARGLNLTPITGLLFLMNSLTPQWGGGRKFTAWLAIFVLATIGEAIHFHRTGKFVITLPKKQS